MKKTAGLLILVLMQQLCAGQDPHYSQYYASPATVNPATTGFFSGDARITALYRQQWPQYGSPFITGTASFEMKPGKFKNSDEVMDRFAAGVMLMYDHTPDAVLKSQHAYLMIAYHKALDEEGLHRIGAGFMGGYSERRLDMSQLTFADQFGSGGFVYTSGEAIPNNKISAFDLHAGVLYSYEDDFKTLYAGGSVFHLTKPKNYFLGNNTVQETIPLRMNINAGANIAIGNVRYAASLLYMKQGGMDQFIFGGAVGIPLPLSNSFLYAGSWYRLNESVIPTLNLQWQNLNLGFSYDVFTSNKTLTKPRSMELSLSFRPSAYRDHKTGCYAF
jgi:type IX secretion system PorP/SprF family membrane protein